MVNYRRGFLKVLGVAVVACAAGYKMGQGGSDDLNNPDVKKLSEDDIKTIDEMLLYQYGSGNRFIEEANEFWIKKFIEAYGPEGRNLLNARYKKMQDYYNSLNDAEKKAVISRLGQKHNSFHKLVPHW